MEIYIKFKFYIKQIFMHAMLTFLFELELTIWRINHTKCTRVLFY